MKNKHAPFSKYIIPKKISANDLKYTQIYIYKIIYRS